MQLGCRKKNKWNIMKPCVLDKFTPPTCSSTEREFDICKLQTSKCTLQHVPTCNKVKHGVKSPAHHHQGSTSNNNIQQLQQLPKSLHINRDRLALGFWGFGSFGSHQSNKSKGQKISSTMYHRRSSCSSWVATAWATESVSRPMVTEFNAITTPKPRCSSQKTYQNTGFMMFRMFHGLHANIWQIPKDMIQIWFSLQLMQLMQLMGQVW